MAREAANEMKRACLAAALFLLGACGCSTQSQSIAAHQGSISVRVVDSSGSPAAGAHVFYLDRSKLDPRAAAALQWALVSEENAKAWVLASVVADSKGEARIPRNPDVADISVETAAESSTAHFDPESADPVLVRLEPDHPRRVRVVDESGHPVTGASLILVASKPRKPDEDSLSLGTPVWAGRTHAPGGTVEIRHLRQLQKSAGDESELHVYARSPDFLGVLSDAYSLLLDPNDDKALTLTVPAPGQVIVSVHRADGKPAPPNTVVQLAAHTDFSSMLDPDEDEGPSMDDAEHGEGNDELFPDAQLVVDGRAIFQGVWTGRSLAVTARAWDGTRRAHVMVEGPRKAGDVVNVDVTLGERLPTLIGRLLDENGSPLRWVDFDVSWIGGDDSALGLDPNDEITDGEGRFRLDLDEVPPIDAARAPSLQFRYWPDKFAGHVPVHAVAESKYSTLDVTVTKPLAPGDVDLGDIRLESVKRPADDSK
jgi:hypothetical protein